MSCQLLLNLPREEENWKLCLLK